MTRSSVCQRDKVTRPVYPFLLKVWRSENSRALGEFRAQALRAIPIWLPGPSHRDSNREKRTLGKNTRRIVMLIFLPALASAGFATFTKRTVYEEQPTPCHPNPNAAQDRAT